MSTSSPRGTSGRRPTIRDVAAAAGVSKSLVSLVFASPDSVRPERRQRVIDAAEALGFRPNQAARSLAATHGSLIGILVADLHNPALADLVDAARAEFAARGDLALATAVSLSGPDGTLHLDDRGLNLFGDLRPSGLLVVGSVPDLQQLEHLLPGERPIVVAGAIAEGLPMARTVRGDDWTGIQLLVEHLVSLGHRDIMHAGGEGGAVAELRARAYEAAMMKVGLGSAIRVVACDYTEEGGRKAAAEALSLPTAPTAIVAVNDLAAVGILAHVATADRQVAVTGYDGTFLAGLPQIDLTTIDSDNAEIGRRAAELIRTPDGPTESLVAPSLVVRGSTRNIRIASP